MSAFDTESYLCSPSTSCSSTFHRSQSPSLCRPRFLLKEPVIDEERGVQWSIHQLPAGLRHEFPMIFPGLKGDDKVMIVTYQKTSIDLVEYSPLVEEQKNHFLGRFVCWADHVRSILSSRSYWTDFIDPCSGFPQYHSRGSVSHNDIDAIQQVFNYFVDSVAGCKIVSHPLWKTACYPAILYSNAPIDEIVNAVEIACLDL